MDSAVNATTDPATVNCTVNSATARVFLITKTLDAYLAVRKFIGPPGSCSNVGAHMPHTNSN